MPSSYLNLMRHGKESFNCRVTISGSVITVSPYVGAASAASPLLARFTPDKASEVVADLSFDWGAATWGIPDVNGITLNVGLQYISAGAMQVVASVQPAANVIDVNATVLAANATITGQVAAPTVRTDSIVWLGRVVNLSRAAGTWVFTSAVFVYGGPASGVTPASG